MGVAHVTSKKNTKECLSMKCGVFPFTLVSLKQGADGVLSNLNPNCGTVHK